jgi:phage recombination protein Bet
LRPEEFPTALALAQKSGIEMERFRVILGTVPATATDMEVATFIYQIARTNLDPVARQIYLVSRGGKCTVQTGIDGYRLVADRTDRYVGSSDPRYDEGLTQYEWIKTGRDVPMTATVTIKKVISGQVGEFTATAAWDAYFPGEGQGYMWRKMPLLMLSKCAEALALRKAFPAELSGIYIAEEMMQSGLAENDVVADEIAKELGVKNTNALLVLGKLEEVGIKGNDPRIVAMIGTSVEDVPATGEGNDTLKLVWNAATAIRKGAQPDDVLVAPSKE